MTERKKERKEVRKKGLKKGMKKVLKEKEVREDKASEREGEVVTNAAFTLSPTCHLPRSKT